MLLHLVMLLVMVRLLRAAPTQCVTLMPGHARPEWRVAVSIIYRFLKTHKGDLAFVHQVKARRPYQRHTISFSSCAAAFTLFDDDGGLLERGRALWCTRGGAWNAGRRGRGPLWAWTLWT